MSTKPVKVAIFYDWLNQWGGAERLLLDILALYPQAHLFTLTHTPSKTPWLPKNIPVISSFINRLPFAHKNPIFYTPLYDIALELFNFSDYDLVISMTSVEGNCLLTSPKTLFVCYCLTPNRYLYQPPKLLKFLAPLLKIYRSFDFIYSRRPDHYLSISRFISHRIQKHYKLPSSLVYPGIDTKTYIPSKATPPKEYFLVVSRLVDHKRVDLAIRACHNLNLPLIIVGTGRDENKLKALAASLKSNTTFLGQVTQEELIKLYQDTRALICPQIEDFGLTPLEAQAAGRPVIAYGQGGFQETIVEGRTGVLFRHQTKSSLILAIKKFNRLSFKSQDCIAQARLFDRTAFMLHFSKQIENIWQKHQHPTAT